MAHLPVPSIVMIDESHRTDFRFPFRAWFVAAEAPMSRANERRYGRFLREPLAAPFLPHHWSAAGASNYGAVRYFASHLIGQRARRFRVQND